MKYFTYLNIDTTDGTMKIPFLGLMELDNFTIGYQNETEMINSLIKMLDLTIDMSNVTRSYITDETTDKRRFTSVSSIKYAKDNYLYESLVEEFSKYLFNDHRKITNTNIKKLVKGTCTYPLIRKYVKEYFNDYLNERETYFHIKDNVECDIKIKKLNYRETLKNKSSKYDAKENSYIASIIDKLEHDEERNDDILDELSKFDLEEIKSKIISEDVPFDGLSKEKSIDKEDSYILEQTTGLPIDTLKDQLFEFRTRSLFRGRNGLY